jgi:CSLREA domain-containing protein
MLRDAAGKVRMGRAMVFCTGLALALGLFAPPVHALDTFTVNSTSDAEDATPDGACDACTLREAIQEANANNNPAEVDRIYFDISGPDVHTIAPSSALPPITEPVIIDGYSQPGASANTRTVGDDAVLKIVLDGIGVSNNGLQISGASDSVIRGLVIKRFGLAGIYIPGDLVGSHIEGNFIGTSRSGTRDRGNGTHGVVITGGASEVVVGGSTPDKRNVISGNGENGVSLSNASASRVKGNYVGTDASGTQDLGNGDTDFAANNLQNNPVITSAKTASGTTTIQATLDVIGSETYNVEFYSNPAGTNEGKKFIGEYVSVANSGLRSFTFSPDTAVSAGRTITATATRVSTGDTSEFSAPQTVASL